MSITKLTEDFGEKIGGARKDLWMKRGLYADDLKNMNSREAEQYVKKDNVWKKPDYQALIDSGVPVDVAYFIKKARDSLNTAPLFFRSDDTPEKKLARQMQYIKTVREFQAVLEKVRTREDAMHAYDRALVGGGYVRLLNPNISSYGVTEKGQDNPVISNKLARAIHVRSNADFEYYFTRQAEKERFGVPKEERIPKGYDILLNDGKYSYSRDNDWIPGTYYVVKGHSILKTNLESREAALQWVQELTNKRGKDGKKHFVPEQLKEIRREGPDFRLGKNATGQDYLDTFAFKGGEFGNWMNQNDRQASLNMGYDALMDLASALEISDKDISYQGTLSIAFGARGSGKALAHYEPMRQVINLTKMRGAGSLAHEWWHGLDDDLGGKFGANGMLSETPRMYAPFKKLVEVMKYKPETPEQAAQREEKQDAVIHRSAERWLDYLMKNAVQKAGDEAAAKYAELKSAFLSGETGTVEKLNELQKSISGHIFPKSERERLLSWERALHRSVEHPETRIGRVETDFYRNSKQMGRECEKDGGYWESNTEMTARAFACYIMDKLPYRSDYLAGHAESAITFVTDKDGNLEVLKAYPQGEERRTINAAMDEIMADLKLRQIFTPTDRTLTQKKATPPAAQQENPAVLEGAQLSLFGGKYLSAPAGQASPSGQDKKMSAIRRPKKVRGPGI